MTTCHIPVMVSEVLSMLNASCGGHFLDCTLGGGGHTEAILQANDANTVVSCDRDSRALQRALSKFEPYGDRIQLKKRSFSELHTLQSLGPFDGILADLGLSTDQLHEERGFSFLEGAPLDMRMDQDASQNASDLIEGSTVRELTRIFQRGGVGKLSRRYAEAIVRARPVLEAKSLGSIIENATPQKLRKDSHPATVVFQALRIEVNAEFDEINALLKVAPALSKENTRFAVISFHSLEDKMVASEFRKWQRGDDAPAWWPQKYQVEKEIGKHLTPKAITPSPEEQERNRSSRSARMRVFEFFAEEERLHQRGR